MAAIRDKKCVCAFVCVYQEGSEWQRGNFPWQISPVTGIRWNKFPELQFPTILSLTLLIFSPSPQNNSFKARGNDRDSDRINRCLFSGLIYRPPNLSPHAIFISSLPFSFSPHQFVTSSRVIVCLIECLCLVGWFLWNLPGRSGVMFFLWLIYF